MSVCVRACERERERETDRETDRQRDENLEAGMAHRSKCIWGSSEFPCAGKGAPWAAKERLCIVSTAHRAPSGKAMTWARESTKEVDPGPVSIRNEHLQENLETARHTGCIL